MRDVQKENLDGLLNYGKSEGLRYAQLPFAILGAVGVGSYLTGDILGIDSAEILGCSVAEMSEVAAGVGVLGYILTTLLRFSVINGMNDGNKKVRSFISSANPF